MLGVSRLTLLCLVTSGEFGILVRLIVCLIVGRVDQRVTRSVAVNMNFL